ncbi:MAG: flagellar basal body L-ring protein FlgH [Armatimonadetes bacterium]|nr:flagellar basal body L-ring protein FlgH [Armatimonadota bacterium]
MKTFSLALALALALPALAQVEAPAPATAPRYEAAAEGAPALKPPLLSQTGSVMAARPLAAPPTAPAATPAAGSAQVHTRAPVANLRYAAPTAPAPQVGYAPQAGQPLPTYPGFPASAAGMPSYPAHAAGAGSLASLFTDLKACQPGDVLTIIITQQAVAAANADKKSDKDLSISMDGGTGLLSLLPAFSVGQTGSSQGKTDDKGSFSVSTTFTAVVTAITPNGNLLVEGEQEVNMDGRPQWVKLRGEVRPYDVSANNTIESTKVANVHIEFVGTRSRLKRKGLFDIIAGAIESVFGIFH